MEQTLGSSPKLVVNQCFNCLMSSLSECESVSMPFLNSLRSTPTHYTEHYQGRNKQLNLQIQTFSHVRHCELVIIRNEQIYTKINLHRLNKPTLKRTYSKKSAYLPRVCPLLLPIHLLLPLHHTTSSPHHPQLHHPKLPHRTK